MFDGIDHPDNKEINYYYPTADLVTGPDIIFFWVARMIMAGYEYVGKMPFKHVYFTGIVRDKLGRKMSKSLGNSPDPLDLIERFGADGVRMGILLSAPAGNDILYDDSLCEQGRNFCNKIWNCFRMVKGLEVADIPQPETSRYAIKWFDAKLGETEAEIADLFSKYRLSEALMEIYKLYCDEFSGWYLEMIKPGYQQPIDKATYEATLAFFDRLLRVLHPFMPFITEELWQNLYERKAGESIMTASFVETRESKVDTAILAEVEDLKAIIAGVRNARASKNIPQKERLTLISPEPLNALVDKLANVEIKVTGDGLQVTEERNITGDNKGYDTNPAYSPDGKHIAWLSMERDGYESDENRLMVMNLETGEKHFVSHYLDTNVDEFAWYNDSVLLGTAVIQGTIHLWAMGLEGW